MHSFTWIDALVVVAYLVAIAALGIYQSVRVRSSGDYFAGGRKFSKWLMMMHALGTGTHADDPVGVVGAAYQRGLSGIWYTYVYLFCTPFYWIIAPFFRRSRYLTTADFFEARFGEGMGLLYAVWAVLIFSVNTGTLLKGTGTLVEAITQGVVPQWIAIVGMTAVFVAYGMAGGLVATVVTESVQGLLIVVMSLLLVPFGLMAVGGFTGLHRVVEASRFSLRAPQEVTLAFIIVGSLQMLIGIVSHPHIMEVCSTGKTEFEGRVGFTYGNFAKRFCALGWALTGVILYGMAMSGRIPAGDASRLAQHRELAFGTAIVRLLPTGFTGLMFAAILAAQMAALSAFMVAGSALITRNLYRRYLKPSASEQEILKLARWAGLIIVGLGVGFAFAVPGVADALVIFWDMAALTGLFMWGGVLWRRANPAGAWASFAVMLAVWMWVGDLGNILASNAHLTLPYLGAFHGKEGLVMRVASYLPVGVVTLVAVSLLTKPHDQKALNDFYTLLRTPVGREAELEKAGVKVVYAGASEPHPWETKHPRLVNVGGFLVALAFSLFILGLLYVLAWAGA